MVRASKITDANKPIDRNTYNPLIDDYVSQTDTSTQSIPSDLTLVHKFEKCASFIIRKNGSNYEVINGSTGKIDFTGTDASTVIQAAINALSSGGLIFIKGGDYLINTPLNLVSYVTLEGESGTWLQPTTYLHGSNGILNLTNVDGVTLKSLQLHGADGSSDLMTATGCLAVTMEDLFFIATFGNGLYAEDCMDFILNRVYFTYVGDFATQKAAIKVRRPSGVPKYCLACSDWYIDRLQIQGIDRGMGIDAYDTDDTIYDWRITNCKLEGPWEDVAVKLRGSEISFTNNYITFAKKENLILNVPFFKINGCYFHADLTQGAFANVVLETWTGIISGCNFQNVAGDAHIIISSECEDSSETVIVNSTFDSDLAPKLYYLNSALAGVPTVHGLVGYNGKTENSGTDTGNGAQQTIAHGLIVQPNSVSVIPDVTGTTVTSIWADATNIYCTVTNGKAYHWSAKIV